MYYMSCFQLPKEFLQEINAMMARFWWGDTENHREIHWVQWTTICVSKLEGGLGFKDFTAFNLALLAKQCWRLTHSEKSLCYRVLQARYFPNNTFYRATIGPRPSYLWRSLMAGKQILEEGSRWRVGNGQSIDVWRDRWLAKPPTYKVDEGDFSNYTSWPVANLIDHEHQC